MDRITTIIVFVLVLLFIVLPAFMYLFGEEEDKLIAQKTFVGFWTAATAVVGVTLVMSFGVKPILAWFFNLF